ncbi:unnamed protein product [Symbiodinium natans]|uniref:Uncharacterized protein n=1 Tax=Symbiodinium natans TaxID=878477 RepID=A0A812QG03_9DINO|nr:unnamed protein product [Symbiodinium natans]
MSNECRDTCEAMFGGVGSIMHGSCRCEAKVDGEYTPCCDTKLCPTTTPMATTRKAMVTCYSLPSADDCRQACEDEYGARSSIVFKHRETCYSLVADKSCCDGIDGAGARALSVLPASIMSISLLVARFF